MLLLRGAMKLRVGLVTAVALVLLASPLAVKAQQTGKVWRILGSENTRPWESFRQALRELGYVEGRNLVLEQRWSEGITDRLPALATELVQLRVDVIVASGTQGVRAAMQADPHDSDRDGSVRVSRVREPAPRTGTRLHPHHSADVRAPAGIPSLWS